MATTTMARTAIFQTGRALPIGLERRNDLAERPSPNQLDELEYRCDALLQQVYDLIDDLSHVRASPRASIS